MSDKGTLNVYARKAAEYLKVTREAASADPLLAAFIADLPDASRVLDLGCGPGLCAAAMAAAGHEAIAMDAVPEMVALAAVHPGVSARIGTFDDIEGDGAYDGVWANFSLLHAPRADLPRHLAAIRRALKPGGLFHIALKTGTGEKRDDLGRYYAYYTSDELTALLEKAGFTVTGHSTGRDRGLDGALSDWVALRAHA